MKVQVFGVKKDADTRKAASDKTNSIIEMVLKAVAKALTKGA